MRALALACALAFVPGVLPTRADTAFDSWTTARGLPQNSVYDVLQTRDGYLWLATFGGLVRYDGVRFTVFTTGNTEGIRSSRFKKLLEEDDGTLWAVTEANGLTRYRDGRFETFTEGLPHESVREFSMRADARGGLAFDTLGGPARWHDGRFSRFEPGEGEPFADAGYPTNTGAVWHLVGGELRRVYRGAVTATLPAGELGDPGVHDSEIRTVFEDRDGGVWFAALNGTVERFVDGRPTRYALTTGRPRDFVQTVCQDRRGDLWFGLSQGGLARLAAGGRVVRYAKEDGFLSDEVDAVFEDAEGGMWFGTPAGLYRLRDQVVTTYSEKDGLANKNAYPIYQDRRGAIWVGSWPGLTRYENGRFERDRTPGGPSDNFVTSICEDAGGRLWVGTWGQGVKVLADGRATAITKADGLADDVVHAIYADRSGATWVGTRDGLSRYENGAFHTFRVEDGLAGNDVSRIFEDSRGTLWVGTQAGLTSYRDGAFTSYARDAGLAGYLIRAIHEDADGTLWVGTYDAGLNRVRDGKVTHYTTREGLFDNGVFQILEDAHGFFWISSNLGIYRVAKAELDALAEGRVRTVGSISYGTPDGMLNAECNGGAQPAGVEAADGRMWFPTQDGVAVIDPQSARPNAIVPPVVVEDFSLDGRVERAAARLDVPAAAENLEVRYTALSFVHPEQVRFRYKLEGLDSDWVEAGTRRTAYYSHVPPGHYVFRVAASNSDGVWNEAGATVAVTVAPPFWRTWWFVAAALVGLAGAALLAHRLRVASLERKHALQEAFSRRLIESQEGERMRIAAELHDSLGQELLVIKNRALLGRRAPDGGAAEQLAEISAAASQAIDGVREIAHGLHPYQLERLGLTKAIESMLRRVAESSGVRFEASVDAIDGLFSKQNEINVYRIVQECTNNVVRHSGATEASVSIRREGRGVRLAVEDNGRGFAADESAAADPRRGGMGLMGITERTRIVGGRCRIRSAPGRGTAVAIELDVDGIDRG